MTTTARLSDRIDSTRYRLKPPVPVPGTGGVIYQAVLAVPGKYFYPNIGEGGGSWVLTPAEVLSDPDYVASHRGIAAIDDDLVAHPGGVDTTTIEHESIGRLMGAEWDEEQQALIGDVLIDVQRGLDAVRSGVDGVSLDYGVDFAAEAGDGYTLRQVRRYDPSNVAITRTPRHGVTRLRTADSEASMLNAEQLQARLADAADPMAMFDSLIQMVVTHSARVAELEKELAAKAGAAAAEAGVDVPDEGADAVPGAGTEPPAEEAAEAKVATMADAVRVADSLGITIDPAWTVADLNKAVADHAVQAVLKGRVGDAWDRASQAGAREQRNRTTTHSPTDV